MVKWELLTDEVAYKIWDESLTRFEDCSPFQTYSWGEYNRALGWQPLHLAANDDAGEIVAMMLGLLRRYPLGIGLLWCVGGPIGNVKTWNENLSRTVSKIAGVKHLYCRFRCDRERNIEDALALNHQGWMRSWYILHSSWSMELDLDKDETSVLSECSGSWRRNLRLSKENKLNIQRCVNPDIDELVSVFAEMQAQKNLPELFSRNELKHLFQHLRSNLIFYCAYDDSGNLVCFRACLTVGNRACDYIAASTMRGRELRASYAVLWRILQDCHERGIRFYDLGGIDPIKNPGVYVFKKETGARHIEALGEWDWASSNWLRWFGNWAIWRRSYLRQAEPTIKTFVPSNESSQAQPDTVTH